jgi:hypothetical protein
MLNARTTRRSIAARLAGQMSSQIFAATSKPYASSTFDAKEPSVDGEGRIESFAACPSGSRHHAVATIRCAAARARRPLIS